MGLIDLISKKLDLMHGDGISVEDVNNLECTLGLKFNKEYQDYLTNFSVMAFDGHEFTGASKSKRIDVVAVTNYERSLNELIPSSLYVIERIDGIIIWQDSSGKIYRSVNTSEPSLIFKSLSEYIKSL